MELVEGKTLDKVVQDRGGKLTLDQSVAIGLSLCETMGAMHGLDMLHRDIKPANLMVRDLASADIVVLDLGLSFDRLAKQETQTRPSETIKNELISLPEMTIHGGNRRDPRSDITCIVSVFFFCLTGRVPSQLIDERKRPPHHRDGMSVRQLFVGDPRQQQVEYLFDTGFDPDIESRFQTVKELQDRLTLVLHATPTTKKDIRQLDLEMGAWLRKHNRPFQLREFAPSAQSLETLIIKHVQGLADLSHFEIGMGGVSMQVALPPGIDLVREMGATLTVAISGSQPGRMIKFVVGAKSLSE
jgi:serine/threonine protein kinase